MILAGLFFTSCQNEEIQDQVQTIDNQAQYKEGSIIIENGQEYLIYEGEKIPHSTSNTLPLESDVQFKAQTDMQWFQAQEQAGGHCIANHWLKSQAYLKKRLEKIPTATSFYTNEFSPSHGYAQQAALIHFIRLYAIDVTNHAKNKKQVKYSKTYKFSWLTGGGYYNGDDVNYFGAYGMTVVVKGQKVKDIFKNYFMLTAFPAFGEGIKVK